MRTILVAAVLAGFVLAGLAPVLAHPGPSGHEHPDRREGKGKGPDGNGTDERRGKGAEARDSHGPAHKGTPVNFTLTLEGSGATRKNVTFAFTLDGEGKGMERMKNGTVRAYRTIVEATVTVDDGNTTHEGVMKVKLSARQKASGNWTWHLESNGKGDGPRINLRGTATSAGDGSFDVEGKGKMVVKQEGKRAQPVKLTEVAGSFSRLA